MGVKRPEAQNVILHCCHLIKISKGKNNQKRRKKKKKSKTVKKQTQKREEEKEGAKNKNIEKQK